MPKVTQNQLFVILAADAHADDGCKEFPGAKLNGGYGALHINGRTKVASRVACELRHGPAPAGKPYALHSCDNPACVNGAHLRWGTAMENAQDRENRNRGNHPRGEAHPATSLDDLDVILIRLSYKWGVRICDLARIFRSRDSIIFNIVYGYTWRHVEVPECLGAD